MVVTGYRYWVHGPVGQEVLMDTRAVLLAAYSVDPVVSTRELVAIYGFTAGQVKMCRGRLVKAGLLVSSCFIGTDGRPVWRYDVVAK